MKKIFLIMMLLMCISLVNAKKITILYDDFEDLDYINNPYWNLNVGDNIYVNEGVLYSDGSIIDQSGRYRATLINNQKISTKNLLIFSFDALLKSVGNPQVGRGVHLAYVDPYGGKQYLFSVANGYTNGFPYDKHSIVFIDQYDVDITEYVKTNYTPLYDSWYNVKVVRENGIWTLFVNEEYIGNHIDELNTSTIFPIIIEFTGSVAIDNINVTIDDGEPEETNLEKYAPVFYLHPEESYEPKEIASLMHYSDLKKNFNDLIKPAPTEIEDITGLNESNKYYMDMKNVNANLLDLPHPEDFSAFQPKVYGREVKDHNDYTHLQYFIFYPFQKFYVMSHEGDWEFVQVTLNDINEIHCVLYFLNGRFLETYYDTDFLDFINDTHPAVLVARGSHNSYGTEEAYFFSGEPPEEIEFWANLLWGFKSLDRLSRDGKIYKPASLETGANEFNYEIEEIDDSTPWINFEGRWGQKTIFPLNYGPKGPKFGLDNGFNWKYPYAFADFPDFPFMSVWLYSPVDIFIEGDGNAIDQEDLLFYTGADEEPEASLVTGYSNYTLYLNCTENGQFTLKIYYYNNETELGIMASYNNITCTESEQGKVDTYGENYFVLFMNETPLLPDNVTTYNQDYVLPDTDQDTVPDVIDNCPGISNAGQEDTDNDKKGDACDDDDDNDSLLDNSDLCPLIYGDYCNGCHMPECTGCAIANCPEQSLPVCIPGICEPTICPENGCYFGTCSNEEYAVFPENPENTCVVTDYEGICTQSECIAECTYDISCDLDDDNDTINDDIDNCPEIYNPEQDDFNDNEKGDACDSPRYYKDLALAAVKEAEPLKPMHRPMLRVAEKAIEDSLKEKYWQGSLIILDDKVFTFEHVAAEHLRNYPEIGLLLAEADSEAVEYLLLTHNVKHYNIALAFYKTAEFFKNRGNYGLSIVFYRQAWHILNR